MNVSDVKIYPYEEIVYIGIKQWKELSESDKMIKRSLWNLIGPYIVCKKAESIDSLVSLVFEHTKLGNDVLISLTHRYDYNAKQAIWFDTPTCTLLQYLEKVSNPQVIKIDNEKGMVLVSNTNILGEINVAFWK